MTNEVALAASLDYDGSLSFLSEQGRDKIIERFHTDPKWERFRLAKINILERLDFAKAQYWQLLDSICAAAPDAPIMHVYQGSDRQSLFLDVYNANFHGNGSSFECVKKLCNDRTTKEQLWLYEPLLMADPKIPNEPYARQRGYAFECMRDRSKPQPKPLDPLVTFKTDDDKEHLSKRPMLLHQMWDFYRLNPKAKHLVFHYVDDRQELINDVLQRLDPKDMPPNMTLQVSLFNHVMVMFSPKPEQFARLCGQVVSATKMAAIESPQPTTSKRKQARSESPPTPLTTRSLFKQAPEGSPAPPEQESKRPPVSDSKRFKSQSCVSPPPKPTSGKFFKRAAEEQAQGESEPPSP